MIAELLRHPAGAAVDAEPPDRAPRAPFTISRLMASCVVADISHHPFVLQARPGWS
jgi:hypothetical protein